MKTNWSEVTLPNGLVTQVRRVGLFELDKIEKNIPGPYTYELKLGNGKSFQVPFDLSEERKKPEVKLEDVEEGSQDYYAWQEYLRYQEAIAYQEKKLKAYEEYAEKVHNYLVETCLPKDVDTTGWDKETWDEFYRLTLNPLVTIEEVSAVLQNSFQG